MTILWLDSDGVVTVDNRPAARGDNTVDQLCIHRAATS